nr:hypothetical protein [Listeria monocytogenes]
MQKRLRFKQSQRLDLKPHTRNKGYNEGSASNENTAYTITFDRDVEFFVDVMDVDETGQALTAA